MRANLGKRLMFGSDQMAWPEAIGLAIEGIESAGEERRVGSVRTILDELEATRAALDEAADGDVVVVCVDHANQVWKELQRRQHGAATESDGLRALVGVIDGEDEIDLDL